MNQGNVRHNKNLPSVISWAWPIDETHYDRNATLSQEELEALAPFLQPRPRDRATVLATSEQQGALVPLIRPLRNAFQAVEGEERLKTHGIYLLLRMCARAGRPFWSWEHTTWLAVLGTSRDGFSTMHQPGASTELRQYVIAAAYLLNCFRDFQALGGIETALLAHKVFGREQVEATIGHRLI